MSTQWHTTNQPIHECESILDSHAVKTALRLSRTGWHTCIDGRAPVGHIFAGPLVFDDYRLVDWAPEPRPILVVAPGSMGTLALDLEMLKRDGQVYLAQLVAELEERLFG